MICSALAIVIAALSGCSLLASGGATLEEGNPWGDRLWGVVDGVGENRLGKILMKVRDELRPAY
jgi:predicted NAD-dependent protein-ADP-ribosyltransferase YbiA (DUF1768 family)